jgi:hypothetical protein
MGKVIPTASFRRAARPDPSAAAAFVDLDDAPGDTPIEAPMLSVVRDLPEPVVAAPTPVAEPVVAVVAPSMDVAPVTPTVVETLSPVAPAAPTARARKDGPKWRRKVVQRSDGRELRKQTFYLDADLSHRFTLACAERQYELSEAIEQAVGLWLKKNGAQA